VVCLIGEVELWWGYRFVEHQRTGKLDASDVSEAIGGTGRRAAAPRLVLRVAVGQVDEHDALVQRDEQPMEPVRVDEGNAGRHLHHGG
jgi:hypothetical protein